MKNPVLIDVYDLNTASNVCNQTLREVIKLPKVSMAHVIMDKGNVSLLHKHATMSEVYFILDGEGILYYGDKALKVEKGAYIVLSPNTTHKLKNIGDCDLKHLVLAIPPFVPEDVEVLEDMDEKDIIPQKFTYDKPPMTSLDGATIYELISEGDRKELDVALAVGILPAGRKAVPHYHKISDEVYYIISGEGKARVGDIGYSIKKGSVIYVPRDMVHALENTDRNEDLHVLCLSSPSYTDGDFILE